MVVRLRHPTILPFTRYRSFAPLVGRHATPTPLYQDDLQVSFRVCRTSLCVSQARRDGHWFRRRRAWPIGWLTRRGRRHEPESHFFQSILSGSTDTKDRKLILRAPLP